MKKLIFVATTPFAVNAFLANHLLALSQDYEVILVVNTGAYPLLERLKANIRVINIGFVRKVSPVRDLICLLQLVLVFHREKPDAVQSIMPKSGLLAMTAAFATFVPRRFHTFTGQVWANKTGSRRCVLKRIDQVITAMTTTVLADSPSQARFLENEGVAKPGQVLVLGEGSIAGVDSARFKRGGQDRTQLRSELGAEDGHCVFLFVGRVTRDKGVPDIVKAIREVTKSVANSQLWIVGPDEDNLVEKLRQDSVGLPVFFFEATPRAREIYGRSRCSDFGQLQRRVWQRDY